MSDELTTEQLPEAVEPGANGAIARAESAAVPAASDRRRTRTPRTFPASSFMEALPLAEAIQRFAAGQRIRRLTLFEQMGRSADSGHSRQLITNSVQYGLTKGGYSADYIELTDEGKLASSDETVGRARLAARLTLAIERVAPFNQIYEEFKGKRLPTQQVLRDFVIEHGMANDNADECVQTFLANARDLGLLTNYAGAERLLTFDTLLDEVPAAETVRRPAEVAEVPAPVSVREAAQSSPSAITAAASDLSDVCFLLSPIGDPDSVYRKHADLIMGSLVEPALDGFHLRLVRADKISKPGMITSQIMDHLVKAPLVIADLSFGNPNVFYELALRHAVRRPAVQIIRMGDNLPFDVGQARTVVLDMTDIYTLVPQIDTYRAEIARQCRAALDETGPSESPLSSFYPKFWDSLGSLKTSRKPPVPES